MGDEASAVTPPPQQGPGVAGAQESGTGVVALRSPWGAHRLLLQPDAEAEAADGRRWRAGRFLRYAALPCGCALPHRAAAAGVHARDFRPDDSPRSLSFHKESKILDTLGVEDASASASASAQYSAEALAPRFALHPFVPEHILFESAPAGSATHEQIGRAHV